MKTFIKFVMLLGLSLPCCAQTFPVENIQIKGLTPSPLSLCVPSVGGLVTNVGCTGAGTLSGLNSVLNYAAGVAVNDGATHTISGAGEPWAAITTVAQLAALQINGTTPFSWIASPPFGGGGVYVIGIINPGSGGTPGTYSFVVTGGGCSAEPAGTFIVGASGSIASVNLTSRGTGCTSAPQFFEGNAPGLTNYFVVPTYIGDSTVRALDIPWLTIQAALMTGKTYIPAGKYKIGSTMALPLMIPPAVISSGALVGTPAAIEGDGYLTADLVAGYDFGGGVPLIAAGDPAGTPYNQLTKSRYATDGTETFEGQMENVGIQSSATNFYPAAFTTPILMDGFAWGARLRTKDVDSFGFNHDWSLVGDHTLFIRPHADGGTVGFEWPAPNAELLGDLQFIDMMSEGQSFASLSVAPSASISATFNGETYMTSPIPIYGESPGCAPIISGAIFDNFDTEFTMIAEIWDSNGFNGTTYTDANKCRGINSLRIGYLHNNFLTVDDSAAAALNIYRRALWDVSQINDTVVNVQASSGSLSPNYASTSFASAPGPITNTHAISSINAIQLGGTLSDLISFTGDIGDWIGQLQTLPLLNESASSGDLMTLEEPGQWSGRLLQVVSEGSYTTTATNDVMEYSNGNAVPGGFSVANDSFAGIVRQSGLTSLPQYTPIAQHGLVPGATGYGGFTNGFFTVSTGVGKLTFTPGSGGTTGTYPLAFAGGCAVEPIGTFTVAGGVIASMTLSANGLNCTSAPTVTLGGSSGITGSSQSVAWPSAQMQAAGLNSPSAFVGSYNTDAGSGGTPSTGVYAVGIDLSAKAPPTTTFGNIATASINVGGNLNLNGYLINWGPTPNVGAYGGYGNGILAFVNSSNAEMTSFGFGPNSTSVPWLCFSGATMRVCDGAGGNSVNFSTPALDQPAANSMGGSCAMSTSTTCTQTVSHTYTAPICIATQQSGTLTGAAVGCTVSGTTVTVTAAVANSETWGFLVFGNPN